VRENYGLENVYAFFTTDGEQRQIQTFMEEKSIDLLEEYKIIYGKHSASSETPSMQEIISKQQK